MKRHAVGAAIGAEETSAWQKNRAVRFSDTQKSPDKRLGVQNARVARIDGGVSANGRLAFRDERAVDELETFDAVLAAAREQRLELPISEASLATISFPHLLCGTPWRSQNS